MLPRFHLFEFHDQSWFPNTLRDGMTECLSMYAAQLEVQQLTAPIIAEALGRNGTNTIVDLCSGACGPVVPLWRELVKAGCAAQIMLTDKYPNTDAFRRAEKETAGAIRGIAEPVDARNVPEALIGMRTLFNSFHHFKPDESRAILNDAYKKRQAIAIFEITGRSFMRALITALHSFVLMFTAVARVRPANCLQLFFTYAIPVLPLTFAWDGGVSCLRAYTRRELLTLTKGMDTQYSWTFGSIKMRHTIFHLTFFVGLPQRATSSVQEC